jgi:hypothetical protein
MLNNKSKRVFHLVAAIVYTTTAFYDLLVPFEILRDCLLDMSAMGLGAPLDGKIYSGADFFLQLVEGGNDTHNFGPFECSRWEKPEPLSEVFLDGRTLPEVLNTNFKIMWIRVRQLDDLTFTLSSAPLIDSLGT